MIRNGEIENEFIVLKRWSSYTPRMPKWNEITNENKKGTEHSKGGGYFLVWNNYGIAIDPGYDFLRNFWELPISHNKHFEVDDIKCIIISHAHDDHSHDIEPITSLFYKKYKKSKIQFNLPIYCSEGVHIKYERLFSNDDFIRVIDLIPEATGNTFLDKEDKYMKSKGISLEYIKSLHHELPWIKNNTGISMKIHLQRDADSLVLGYTSDTQYSSALANFFEDADVLIMHFGNFGPEFNSTPKYDQNHLGLMGCSDLITSLLKSKISLFLLGEFGEEEIGNDRMFLCNLLESLTGLRKEGKHLLPMDIGLRIQLPSLNIFCEEHNHFVPYRKISAHLLNGHDDIVYICKE